jgi:hypothetical protein
MADRTFIDTHGYTHVGPIFIEGPRGLVVGRTYFHIYLIDPATGRYAFHSHGYDAGWIDYFRVVVGLATKLGE